MNEMWVWNIGEVILVGITQVPAETCGLVPLFPPQIPRDWPGIESGLRREGLATNRVSNGAVSEWRRCKFQLHASFILSVSERWMQVSNDELKSYIRALSQEYTNPGHQVAVATTFCKVAPHVCWSSVCNLFRVIHRATGISSWLIDFWRMCAHRH